MRKFMSIVLTIIVALMAYAMPVQAERGHGGHGGGWGWGLGWGLVLGGLAYPYYAHPYYPYYDRAPVIIEQPPTDVYVQPAPQAVEPTYWYYCQNPRGYYPYVAKCPNGWMRVVPAPPPE